MVFAVWFFAESGATHDTLAKNHANLLEEIRVVPLLNEKFHSDKRTDVDSIERSRNLSANTS
jgi:hypothetical protein